MALDLTNYRATARDAVRTFWGAREEAKNRQNELGRQDQGERSAVTAGKNMDGFVKLVVDVILANGMRNEDIMLNRSVLTLPGYFRPTKLWDVLIIRDHRLVAALEFKSQVGPSFGNNANNRAEEAIGTSSDFWRAYRERAFGDIPRPFLGYFFVLENAPESRSPVRDRSPHYSVFPEFVDASYAERYNILCRKLVQENLFTSAAVLLTPQSGIETGEFSEMSDLTGLTTFVSTLAGHIAADTARWNRR